MEATVWYQTTGLRALPGWHGPRSRLGPLLWKSEHVSRAAPPQISRRQTSWMAILSTKPFIVNLKFTEHFAPLKRNNKCWKLIIYQLLASLALWYKFAYDGVDFKHLYLIAFTRTFNKNFFGGKDSKDLLSWIERWKRQMQAVDIRIHSFYTHLCPSRDQKLGYGLFVWSL